MELLLRWTIWPMGSCFNDLTSFRSRYNLKYKSPCVCLFFFFYNFLTEVYVRLKSSSKHWKSCKMSSPWYQLHILTSLIIHSQIVNFLVSVTFTGIHNYHWRTQIFKQMKSRFTSIYILLVFNFYLFTLENVHRRSGESKTRKNSMYLCNV